MENLQILINDVDKTHLLLNNTLTLSQRADRRNMCSFDIKTEAQTTAEGKNLFDEEYLAGYGIGVSVWLVVEEGIYAVRKIKPNTTYTLSRATNDTDRFRIASFVDYPEEGMYFTHKTQDDDATSLTITTGENDKYLGIYVSYSGQIPSNVQLEEGNTATDYEPYSAVEGYMPRVGMDLKVYRGTELVFGGVIKSCPAERPGPPGTPIFVRITSDGYDSILNRRTTTITRNNMLSGDIVKGLITNYLSAEGITEGVVEDGVILDSYSATVKNTRQIMDELADYTGYQWWIDDEKKLNFKETYFLSFINIVKNGDFSDGSTHWSTINANTSTLNNILTVHHTDDVATVYQDTAINATAGDRIFFRGSVASPDGVGKLVNFFVSGGLEADSSNRDFTEYIFTSRTTFSEVYGSAEITSGGNVHVYVDSELFPGNDLSIKEMLAVNIDDYPELQGLTDDEINEVLSGWWDVGRDTFTDAPHDIDDEYGTFNDYRDVSVEENLEMYRNTQWVRGALLPSGKTLQAYSWLQPQIDARIAIEGGTGVYGDVEVQSWITDETKAQALADNLLKKYGQAGPPIEIEFSTMTNLFRPNSKLYVNLPTLNINERYFHIEEVTIADVDGKNYRSTIRAYTRDEEDFSTQDTQNAVDYFNRIVDASTKREERTDLLNNLLNDHSFELISTTGAIDSTHNDYAVDVATLANGAEEWRIYNTVRIFSALASGEQTLEVIYWKQAYTASASSGFLQQYVRLKEGQTYTVSGYAYPHPTRNATDDTVTSRFLIIFQTSGYNEISRFDDDLVLTTAHEAGAMKNVRRHAVTFTAPANCAWVRIIPYGVGSQWVVYDGMQLVPGEKVAPYEPENQLWNYIRSL